MVLALALKSQITCVMILVLDHKDQLCQHKHLNVLVARVAQVEIHALHSLVQCWPKDLVVCTNVGVLR